MQLRPAIARRPGFTLVEMLVVLTIIVVLLSLISGAVLQMLGWGPRLQAQSELSQMNQSVELFKQKYGMYPPSCIFLANNQQDYTNAASYFTTTNPNAFLLSVVQKSPGYLQRIFPKMTLPPGAPANAGQVTNLTVDWTGGQTGPLFGNNRWIGTFLEGDQALVFFLGGMQVPQGGGNVNQCIGFAAFAQNPTLMSGPRNDPLFDFSPSRLTQIGTAATPLLPARYARTLFTTNPFFVYIDPFNRVEAGMPYIYFSSNGSRNGYTNFPLNATTFVSDCPSVPSNPTLATPANGVYAYQQTAPGVQPALYLNPNTFQIISAGADGIFSTGGYWNPGVNPVDPFTKDNQSNFNGGGMMGTRG
jgi:prepilin-type N-terminal cleavage/methylation domain-containing protein